MREKKIGFDNRMIIGCNRDVALLLAKVGRKKEAVALFKELGCRVELLQRK